MKQRAPPCLHDWLSRAERGQSQRAVPRHRASRLAKSIIFWTLGLYRPCTRNLEIMSVQKHRLDKRLLLSKQLYDSGYLWSYKAIGDNAMLSDEELIVNGLSHLEFEDMPLLFEAFPYRQIKRV